MEPGDVVNYKSPTGDVRQAIIELEHISDGTSNFQLISYEAGLEAVVNAFGDSADVDDEEGEADRTQQVVSINKSGLGSAQMKVRGLLLVRPVIGKVGENQARQTRGSDIHAGMLLAHRNSGYGQGGRLLVLVLRSASAEHMRRGLSQLPAPTGLTQAVISSSLTNHSCRIAAKQPPPSQA